MFRNSPICGLHFCESDFIVQVALATGHKSSQINKHQLTSLKANTLPSCHVERVFGIQLCSLTTKKGRRRQDLEWGFGLLDGSCFVFSAFAFCVMFHFTVSQFFTYPCVSGLIQSLPFILNAMNVVQFNHPLK